MNDVLNFREVAILAKGFLRRQFFVITLCVICSLTVGLLYFLSTPPRFTASAKLLIDLSKVRILQQQQGAIDAPVDAAQLETQVELLKSDKIALAIVNEFRLNEDPEFTAPSRNYFRTALYRLFPDSAYSESSLVRRAVTILLANREVTRLGRTYVLDVSVTSLNPARAAQLANAIAEAYIDDQLEAKYQATRRAGSWLQERIRELRQQASDADRLVLEYKEKNNIVDVSGNSPGATRLLGDQQLTDLNTQLTTARAAAAEAKARLDRIDEVMKRDVPDLDIGDSLRSEVINKLRSNYLELAAKEGLWSSRYGADHIAAVHLRGEMRELRRSINQELSRISQSVKNEHEIAKARVESLERSLRDLVTEAQAVNRDRLGLRELESNAQKYHAIYENFLQRHMEAIQQQSFPITEARIVSPAEAPLERSGPVMPVILGAAAAFGLALGIGLSLSRELFDRVFRTPKQVEEELGTTCIAVVPKLPGSSSYSSSEKPAPKIRSVRNNRTEHLRMVVDEPLSPFAEAFRSIKVSADLYGALRGNKVIGVTSTLAHEGKSTIASNFAQILAQGRKTVILVDGDLRNPSLSRELSFDACAGLTDVLSRSLALEQVMLRDEATNLMFLPHVSAAPITQTSELLSSHAFNELIEELKSKFDYVVVDLPPLAAVVDARAAAPALDSFLYVIEWGKTEIGLASRHLISSPEVQEKMLGVVLNKADKKMFEKYESAYSSNYSKYYFYNNPSKRA
jgi:succinoglycan biosynthesis transport protein ExoP